MARTVVIGYGNPLRGDDAAGVAVAQALQERLKDRPDVTVEAAFQLLPEHAALIAEADRVLFVDAALDGSPGEVRSTVVMPVTLPGSPLTHTLSPGQILGMCQQLFGKCPHATLWTLTGWEFEHQEGMSERIQQAMLGWVEQIVEDLLHPPAQAS